MLVAGQVGLGRPAAAGAAQRVVIRFSGNEIHAVAPRAGGVDVGAGGGRVDRHLPGQLAARRRRQRSTRTRSVPRPRAAASRRTARTPATTARTVRARPATGSRPGCGDGRRRPGPAADTGAAVPGATRSAAAAPTEPTGRRSGRGGTRRISWTRGLRQRAPAGHPSPEVPARDASSTGKAGKDRAEMETPTPRPGRPARWPGARRRATWRPRPMERQTTTPPPAWPRMGLGTGNSVAPDDAPTNWRNDLAGDRCGKRSTRPRLRHAA